MLKKLHDTFACCIGDVVIHCVNYCSGILEVRPKFAGGEFKRVPKARKGQNKLDSALPCVLAVRIYRVVYTRTH